MYIGLNPVDKRHLPPQFSGIQDSTFPKKLRTQEGGKDRVTITRGSTSAAAGLATPPPPEEELFPDVEDELSLDELNELDAWVRIEQNDADSSAAAATVANPAANPFAASLNPSDRQKINNLKNRERVIEKIQPARQWELDQKRGLPAGQDPFRKMPVADSSSFSASTMPLGTDDIPFPQPLTSRSGRPWENQTGDDTQLGKFGAEDFKLPAVWEGLEAMNNLPRIAGILDGDTAAVALGSSSADPKPKSESQIKKEEQARNKGLVTVAGEPDVKALERQWKEAAARNKGLVTAAGEADVKALQRSHYEGVKSEARQMGMKIMVYRSFLTEESQKRNFIYKSPFLRKQVQVLLEEAKKQGIPAGEETQRFVKAQLAWRFPALPEGSAAAGASSSSRGQL